MSNQLQITGGAKVRSLEGVITGTTGVLSSVPLGGANGVATLDSGGKVPVSQLPSSVVTYLGTWNAATNTPTLTNGVGDAGDMYICNVAGTVNFGAGPVTFAVGDWVLYGSGTWQKSSGQNGTVTSVGASITGSAIGITGSPITTAGTLAFAFSGTSAQYVNGAGNLTTFPTLITSIGLSMPSAFSVANSPLTANGSINVTGAGTISQYIDGTGALQTFPSLTGYVPYTGATADVDLGTHVLNAQSLHVKGTAGAGHLGLKHQSATPTASANESLIFADVNGNLGWQNDNLYLTTLISNANTANRSYTFPNASGTLALTSDISYPVTSVFGRTGAVVATSGDYTTTLVTEGTNLYYTDARARAALSFTAGSGAYNSTTGVITIPTNTSQLTNGAAFITLASLSAGTGISYNNTTGVISSTITQYTDAMARAAISGGTGISYNSTTGVITNTITQYTDAQARAAISLTTTGTSGAATYNSTTGVLNIPQYADAYVGTVTSVAMTVPTGLSVSGSPITTSGTLAVSLAAGYSIPTTASQSNWDTAYTNRITTANSPLSIASNTISISQATTSTNGYLSSTDWNTFNSKQSALSFTAPLINTSGTITITQATTSTNGYLSSTDWNTFNNKQATITLTTTGTSGAATFISNTLNIPQYQSVLTNPVTGTGTTNYLPKFTGTSAIGNSQIFDNGTFVGINTTTNGGILSINGTDPLIGFQNSGTTKWQVGLENTSSDRFVWYNNTSASYRMILTSSGNLGLGVTPSAWGTTGDVPTAFQFGASGMLYSYKNTSSSSSHSIFGANAYFDGSAFKYINTKEATYYRQYEGTHAWFNAPSGTAGAAISFTQAMTLDASGNLSVGTPTANRRITVGGSSNAYMSFNATSSRNTTIGSDGFGNFIVYDDTAAAYRMVISSSGNVGIGTTSPGTKLQVVGTIAAQNNADGSDATGIRIYGSGTSKRLDFVAADGNVNERISGIGTGGVGTMTFSVNNDVGTLTERMRITSGGNLLVGTTTDSGYKLDVNGTGRFTSSVTASYFKALSGSIYSEYIYDGMYSTGTDQYINTQGAYNTRFYTNGGERMRITSGGNVGIGTSSPSNQLTIKPNAYDSNAMVITRYDSDGYQAVTLGTENTANGFILLKNSSNTSTVKLSTSGVSYFNGGNVGIGTNSPAYKFVVSNGGALGLEINPAGSGYTEILNYNRSTAAYQQLQFSASSVLFNCSVTATSFFESSDSRLKTLIQDNYQTKGIASITPKLYTKNGKVELGYYAQDFIGVLDNAISKGSDDMLSLSYREVHTAKIYALEQEIKELKAKLNN